MSDHYPLISVIMPVFNAECYLEAAVLSILNQSYKNIELLVIDDASSDESYQAIKSFTDTRIKIYRNKTNEGYLKSVNLLFTKCRGSFIAFQDADDWSSLDRLEKQLEVFKQDPELMFCGTQCIYSKNEKELRRSTFPLLHDDVVLKLEHGDTVILCGASVMLRRKLLIDYPGYRAFYDRIGSEDLDWFWRMLVNNKYMNLPEYLYNYRSSPSSITRKLDLNPLRYHSTQIALLAYWQYKLTGSDVLMDKQLSLKLITQIRQKYSRDGSLIFYRAAISQLAFGQLDSYLWCLKESIKRKGFSWTNIKLLLIWLPLFVFLHLSPKRTQRKIIEKSNIRFLKEMGVDARMGKVEKIS